MSTASKRPVRNIRAEIAEKIHEGLGQHITGLLLSARALETSLTRKKLQETGEARYLVGQLKIAQSDISHLLSWLDDGKPR